jgi:hypothetical protein
MSPADQKKRFRTFAKQLENGVPPTKEQTEYLIHIFRWIGNGRDPTRILGLTYENGKSKQAEIARTNLDLIFHWIACATEPDTDKNGDAIKAPYSLAKAFVEGSKIAKKLFGNTKSGSYDAAYIKKMWYQHKKQGKASIYRTAADQDSIYEYPVPTPKK